MLWVKTHEDSQQRTGRSPEPFQNGGSDHMVW